MAASAESFVTLPDGSKICYQIFGTPNATPILLVAGGGQSMLSWHEDFIAQISEAGSKQYYIIRYDIRDTGRSTHYALLEEKRRQYSISDLCDDALALLNHLSVQAAHFVGFSLGGGIAWLLAARHPDRVKSLVLISSSPVGPNPGPQDDIPGLDASLAQNLSAVKAPSDWHDKEQVVRFQMDFDALMSPRPVTPSTENQMHERAGMAFDRVEQGHGQLNSFFNQHGAAWTRWPREELVSVRCPTAVIHGELDHNVPLRHGQVLAEEIKNAKLLTFKEMGHELPRPIWPAVIQRIVEFSV